MMKEPPWLAIRLFIKKKWWRLYNYHNDDRIGWDCCFLKEDTVRRWPKNFRTPKTFDDGAGRHVVLRGRPKGAKDVSAWDFRIFSKIVFI